MAEPLFIFCYDISRRWPRTRVSEMLEQHCVRVQRERVRGTDGEQACQAPRKARRTPSRARRQPSHVCGHGRWAGAQPRLRSAAFARSPGLLPAVTRSAPPRFLVPGQTVAIADFHHLFQALDIELTCPRPQDFSIDPSLAGRIRSALGPALRDLASKPVRNLARRQRLYGLPSAFEAFFGEPLIAPVQAGELFHNPTRPVPCCGLGASAIGSIFAFACSARVRSGNKRPKPACARR